MGSNELEKSPDFLRLLYAITKNCVHNCEDHGSLDLKSAVQYMKHVIYHDTFIPHGLIKTHN